MSTVFVEMFSAAASYDRRRGAEQDLFLLVAHDGLPVADAARALGLTPVAGRMRLARARRKLRAAMKPGGHPGMRQTGEPRREIAAAKEKP